MLITSAEFDRIKHTLRDESFNTVGKRILQGDYLNPVEYRAILENTHDARMTWWRTARLGLFIHFGLYSLSGNGEWTLARDGVPMQEYEALADRFMPAENAAEEWVLTAKNAGAGYAILTTRHHDGFSLWDSKVNPFNSCRYGCKRDIVAEFVAACRKHGMRIGFYSSLMDWRHPDAARMAFDPAARTRFLQYLEALNTELLTQYGDVDILWYDMPYPNESADGWDTIRRDQIMRALQPNIILNDRGRLWADFSTREEVIETCSGDWESCLTLNSLSWGYVNEAQAVAFAYTPQMLVKKLCYVCRNRGNLLLNVGPRPDGTLADYEKQTLKRLGQWIGKFPHVVYGDDQRTAHGLAGLNCYGEYGSGALSEPTAKGHTVYLWQYVWPQDGVIPLAGYDRAPRHVYFADTQIPIAFEYDAEHCRILLKELPKDVPEAVLGLAVIAVEFEEFPGFRFCRGYSHVNDGYIDP